MAEPRGREKDLEAEIKERILNARGEKEKNGNRIQELEKEPESSERNTELMDLYKRAVELLDILVDNTANNVRTEYEKELGGAKIRLERFEKKMARKKSKNKKTETTHAQDAKAEPESEDEVLLKKVLKQIDEDIEKLEPVLEKIKSGNYEFEKDDIVLAQDIMELIKDAINDFGANILKACDQRYGQDIMDEIIDLANRGIGTMVHVGRKNNMQESQPEKQEKVSKILEQLEVVDRQRFNKDFNAPEASSYTLVGVAKMIEKFKKELGKNVEKIKDEQIAEAQKIIEFILSLPDKPSKTEQQPQPEPVAPESQVTPEQLQPAPESKPEYDEERDKAVAGYIAALQIILYKEQDIKKLPLGSDFLGILGVYTFGELEKMFDSFKKDWEHPENLGDTSVIVKRTEKINGILSRLQEYNARKEAEPAVELEVEDEEEQEQDNELKAVLRMIDERIAAKNHATNSEPVVSPTHSEPDIEDNTENNRRSDPRKTLGLAAIVLGAATAITRFFSGGHENNIKVNVDPSESGKPAAVAPEEPIKKIIVTAPVTPKPAENPEPEVDAGAINEALKQAQSDLDKAWNEQKEASIAQEPKIRPVEKTGERPVIDPELGSEVKAESKGAQEFKKFFANMGIRVTVQESLGGDNSLLVQIEDRPQIYRVSQQLQEELKKYYSLQIKKLGPDKTKKTEIHDPYGTFKNRQGQETAKFSRHYPDTPGRNIAGKIVESSTNIKESIKESYDSPTLSGHDKVRMDIMRKLINGSEKLGEKLDEHQKNVRRIAAKKRLGKFPLTKVEESFIEQNKVDFGLEEERIATERKEEGLKSTFAQQMLGNIKKIKEIKEYLGSRNVKTEQIITGDRLNAWETNINVLEGDPNLLGPTFKQIQETLSSLESAKDVEDKTAR